MKTETLDALFAARDDLSDMIIELKPTNDAERKQIKQLVLRRDRVTGAINRVIVAEFNDAASGLADAITALRVKTESLDALAKTLSNVAMAIGVADEAIQLVMSVLAIAAA